MNLEASCDDPVLPFVAGNQDLQGVACRAEEGHLRFPDSVEDQQDCDLDNREVLTDLLPEEPETCDVLGLSHTLEFHYFCSDCLQILPNCKMPCCPNESCKKCFESTGAVSSFIAVPLELQLINLIQRQ